MRIHAPDRSTEADPVEEVQTLKTKTILTVVLSAALGMTLMPPMLGVFPFLPYIDGLLTGLILLGMKEIVHGE